MTQQKDITAVKGKNRKIKGFDILAIISTLGIIGWITTDYFGGMIIFLVIQLDNNTNCNCIFSLFY